MPKHFLSSLPVFPVVNRPVHASEKCCKLTGCLNLRRAKYFAQSFRDDLGFARLHLPNADGNLLRGGIGGGGSGSDLYFWVGFAELLADLIRRELNLKFFSF